MAEQSSAMGWKDAFEPGEVPEQTIQLGDQEIVIKQQRVGNPRSDAFALTIREGQVYDLVGADPNRCFFYVASDSPYVFIGSNGQLQNGLGWPVATKNGGVSFASEKFTTTHEQFVKLIPPTPGTTTATVYVWVEFAA